MRFHFFLCQVSEVILLSETPEGRVRRSPPAKDEDEAAVSMSKLSDRRLRDAFSHLRPGWGLAQG